MPEPTKISLVDIIQSASGKIKIKYNCRTCNAKLTSERDEIAYRDSCPDCGAEFYFDPRVEESVQRMEGLHDRQKEVKKENKIAVAERKKREAAEKQKERKAEMESAKESVKEFSDNVKKSMDEENRYRERTRSGGAMNIFLKYTGAFLVIIGVLTTWISIIDNQYIFGRFVNDVAMGSTANSLTKIEYVLTAFVFIVSGLLFVAVAILRDIRYTISMNYTEKQD